MQKQGAEEEGGCVSQPLAFPRLCGAWPVWPSAAAGELLDGGADGGADVALHRPPRQAHLCPRPCSGQVREMQCFFSGWFEWGVEWVGTKSWVLQLKSYTPERAIKSSFAGSNTWERAWVQGFSVLWLILTCSAAAVTDVSVLQSMWPPIVQVNPDFSVLKIPFSGYNFKWSSCSFHLSGPTILPAIWTGDKILTDLPGLY